MQKIIGCLVGAFALLIQAGCSNTLEEHHRYITRGDLQIGIRTQEWGASGIVNVEACLMAKGSHEFPKEKESLQCFFRGYDLNQLGVRWNLDDDVTISIACGQVMMFRNWALLDLGRSVRIHANLTDRCTTTHYQFVGLDEGDPYVTYLKAGGGQVSGKAASQGPRQR